jgi:hypothetical protein
MVVETPDSVTVHETPVVTIDELLVESTSILQALTKLHRDLRKNAATLSTQEIRYIVDTYYTLQKYRIISGNQVAALSRSEEPVALLQWVHENNRIMEQEIPKWMLAYASSVDTGKWALSICGIGPVLAAGFLANLNLETSTNISKWWAFAGLDPTKVWEKGQKRPWNNQLKVLAFKAGESFVKVQNRDSDVYGKLYAKRKAEYTLKNESGGYAERSADILAKKKFGHDTEAYKWYSQGKLPPAHIHAMARRWAVKIFMSHMWSIAYEEKYKTKAPNPWILEPGLGGHIDRILVPNHNCPYGEAH